MTKNDKIFPAEFISQTTEYHFQKYNQRTYLIYKIVLGFVLLALGAMFFIKININVKSAGIIKSTVERNEVKALVSGRIDSMFLKENMAVKKGQVLVVLKAEALSQQDLLARAQQNEYEAQLSDLKQLVKIANTKSWSKAPRLTSALYGQEYVLLKQRSRDAAAVLESARRNYQRYSYLYQNRAISASEYDAVQLAYKNAQSALQLIYDEQGGRWQAALNNLKLQIRGLKSQGESFKQEKDFYTLRAPVNGTIQSLKGIQPGGVIAANEVIAEISPETGLIVEAFVLPKDIGLLKPGVAANFQVDAFNYNQWGTLTGKVVSVSNDIYADAGQQPYFKVRCLLDKNYLQLSNGYKGRLKKGMTIQANFYVTRRTLFQLLYDKADDWLNPNQLNESTGKQG